MERKVVPGWFARFVRSITCWQDDSPIIRPNYKSIGEDYIALGRCRQGHVYVAVGLAKLPPEIAGDSFEEAQEAANFWIKYYHSYGFACAKCSSLKFDTFSFDRVEAGKANVYQVCNQCRETQYVTLRFLYHENLPPISMDEVLDVYEILEGKNKKKKVKSMKGLQKLLNKKGKTKT